MFVFQSRQPQGSLLGRQNKPRHTLPARGATRERAVTLALLSINHLSRLNYYLTDSIRLPNVRSTIATILAVPTHPDP